MVIADRLETVLLARMSLGGKLTTASLAKLTARYKPTTMTDADWLALVTQTVERLRANGVVDDKLHAGKLDDRLGAYSANSWDRWVDYLLPALALGVRLDDRAAPKRTARPDGWVSAIAARVLGLWGNGPPPSLQMLGDDLVWRELGLTGVVEKCPPRLRAHFLKQHIAMTDGTPAQLVRQIAFKAVGAPNKDKVRDALVRSWLTGAFGAGDAPSLVDAARDAARDAKDGVFGDHKVFISSVWDAVRSKPAWTSLTLGDFKAALVAAHRERQLTLARADYVSAMDPALVAASEAKTDGATFHFIVRESNR